MCFVTSKILLESKGKGFCLDLPCNSSSFIFNSECNFSFSISMRYCCFNFSLSISLYFSLSHSFISNLISSCSNFPLSIPLFLSTSYPRVLMFQALFYSPALLSPVSISLQALHFHTGLCKRTGGCYNELVVAFFTTGGGVKGKKYILWTL